MTQFLKKLWPYLAMIGLWLIAFNNNYDVVFFYDDYGQIEDNAKIRDISNLRDVIFCGIRQIRVFQNISFAIDYWMAPQRFWPFHLTNNLLHLLTTFVLFQFLKKIKGIPYSVIVLTCLLYVCHPLQLQTVSYVMGRTSIIQNLFIFWLLYETTKGEDRSRTKILIILLLSYLVKENNALMPFLVILYDFFLNPERINRRTFKREYVWYILSLTAYMPLFHYLKDPVDMYVGVVGLKLYWPVTEYFLTQGYYALYYLFLFFNPSHQSIYHEYLPFTWNIGLLGGMAWGTLFSGAAFFFFKRKKYPVIAFFLFYFLILYGSTNSFLQLVNPFAEYRLSLTIVSVMIFFSSVLYKTLKHYSKAFLTISFAFLIFFASFTHRMNTLYSNSSLPWIYADQSYPKSLIIRQELARVHTRFGNYDKVFEILNQIISEEGHIPFQIFTLKSLIAHTYFFQQNYNKAYEHFQKLFSEKWKPQDYIIVEYLITLYILGKVDELEKFILYSKQHKVLEKPVSDAIESIMSMEKSKLTSSYSMIRAEQLIQIYYNLLKKSTR